MSGPILTSSWYAQMLGGDLVDVEGVLRARLPPLIHRASTRIGPLRGLAMATSPARTAPSHSSRANGGRARPSRRRLLARDRGAVRALNAGGRARVVAELSRAEHDDEIRRARAYVISLTDEPGSAGQVRLMTATQARTPVVASSVPALEGYIAGDETTLRGKPIPARAPSAPAG